MTEHIDHAAKARKLLARYENASLHIIEATAAQAHATLALVEQQRIANLIALSKSKTVEYLRDASAGLSQEVPHPIHPESLTVPSLRPEIRTALGLDD